MASPGPEKENFVTVCNHQTGKWLTFTLEWNQDYQCKKEEEFELVLRISGHESISDLLCLWILSIDHLLIPDT